MKHEIQKLKERWYKFKKLDEVGKYDIIYAYMLLASAIAVVGSVILILVFFTSVCFGPL